MKKTNILVLIILAALVALVFWFFKTQYNSNNQTTNTNQTNNSGYTHIIKFSFDNQETISIEYPYTFSPDQTLLKLTKDIAQQNDWAFDSQDYGDMGVLVTQIRDKINGQDQKYWQYFVDEKQPLISADKYFPAFGQTIEWKFQKSEF